MEEKFHKRITDEITSDIPRNWKSKSLNELCKIKIGGTPKTNIKSFWNGPIKWATAKDISNASGRFIQNTEKTITKEGSDRSAAKILPANTIVITARGTVGKMAITPEPMAINQTCYGLLAENIDNMFLYYSVKSALEKLMVGSYGTVFDTITIKSFEDVILLVPNNLAEQRAIAKILSDLDSKIELNQKMNKTLEAISQATFKHWFIDFEFPNEEGKPYKSSGGEMVDSELGEIPKGWNIRKLGDLGKIVCGKTPSTKDETNFGQDIPFITIPDMRGNVFTFKTERYLSTKGANSQETKFLPPLSVCVSCIATPGLVTLTSTTSQTNQQINSIICKEGVSPFYVYFVSKEKSQEIINKGLGGTATLNLNTSEFSNLRVILPDLVTLKNFHDFTTQFFKKILNNSKEILVLNDIRDSLLPRLMSGRIRVPLEE